MNKETLSCLSSLGNLITHIMYNFHIPQNFLFREMRIGVDDDT